MPSGPKTDRNASDYHRLRVVTCLLWVGGIMALLDGIVSSNTPRSAIRFAAALVAFSFVFYLRRTSNLRGTILCVSLSSAFVFFGDFVLFGDPIYFAIGFTIPVFAALMLSARDAVWVLAAYCLAGIVIGALVHQEWLVPHYDVPSPIERSIAVMTMICAVAGPTMWMQRLLRKSELGEWEHRYRFETICDTGVTALIEADESGKVTFVRGRLMEELGYKPAELLGQHQFDLVVPTDRTTLDVESINPDEGVFFDGEICILDASGNERWMHLTGCSHRTARGERVFLNTLRDVHDAVVHRKHYYELSRLESLGNVCGGLAHDFNNLLTVIGIHADGVTDKTTREGIVRAQQQAAKLTAGLLTFARKQTYRDEDIELGSFLRSTQPLIRKLLPANVVCAWSFDDNDMFVRMDPSQLQQVLINLVTNSCHAMPDGGTISIGLESLSSASVDTATSRVAPEQVAQITVADSGQGMDAETASKAMEPFFTTKPRGLGTGLGLATAHGAVAGAGGSMVIHSKPGEGTEISLLIPLGKAPRVAAKSDSSIGVRSNSHAQRVLLVEDHKVLAASVRRILESFGHTVSVCHSAETAWNALTKDAGDAGFDLLISDVVLPGMNGVEFSRLAISHQCDLKVILASGYQTTDLKIIEEHRDAMRFLSKPFGREQLQNAIAELCEPKALI